jgi:hypothetical protein
MFQLTKIDQQFEQIFSVLEKRFNPPTGKNRPIGVQRTGGDQQ